MDIRSASFLCNVLALALFGAAFAEPQADPPDTAIIMEASERIETGALINESISGPHRSDESMARNIYRSPVETLLFFGLRPEMTVVEVWPGGGWYTEVLAPVLREKGRLVAAQFPEDAESRYQSRTANAYASKLAAEPDIYDRVQVVPFSPPEHPSLGPSDSADMVLLSRNFHSFIGAGLVDDVLHAAFDVLRPGGILAVIQHRAGEDSPPAEEGQQGYVRESYVVDRVTEAGFQLEDRSEINANPNDLRDHPEGVWTLPPTLRYCGNMEDVAQREACERHYRAIGESDRMTLRFVKPQ
jgi:predicted methyltransferase